MTTGNPHDPALVWLWLLPSAFGERTWRRALALVPDPLLAQGPRVVASALRAGSPAPGFSAYHRVFSLRRWSGRAVARLLLAELLQAFVPPLAGGGRPGRNHGAPLGRSIAAWGLPRPGALLLRPLRQGERPPRWFALALLVLVPWSGRAWALPFLTALASSGCRGRGRGTRHKKLTDWACQPLLQLARWLPGRRVAAVSDRSRTEPNIRFTPSCFVCVMKRLDVGASFRDT